MRKGVIAALSALAGAAAGAGVIGKMAKEKEDRVQKLSDKHLALFLMMNRWVRVKQEGKTLSEYFVRKSYKRIAIYGMSYAGETLLEELKDSGIEVAYGIDKKADEIYADIDIVSPESELEPVDAIVVTSIFFVEEIKEMLSAKIDCPIVSLEDIIYKV